MTCIIFPNDVQEMEYEDPPRKHGSTFTGIGYSAPRVIPEEVRSVPESPPVNYAEYAESIGLRGIRIESPDDIEGAWKEAFGLERPVVVDALTDPSVPPSPPHIKTEQAVHYAKAIFKGDADAWDTVKQSFKDAASGSRERFAELTKG